MTLLQIMLLTAASAFMFGWITGVAVLQWSARRRSAAMWREVMHHLATHPPMTTATTDLANAGKIVITTGITTPVRHPHASN